MEPKLSKLMYMLMYGGFLFIGIVGGVTGPLIPAIRDNMALGYGIAGLIFSAQSAGSFVILLSGGWLIHVFGKKKIIFSGGILFALGLLGSAFALNLPWLLTANLFIGAGMSFLDIGISTLCLDAHPEGKGKALGYLHAFFGAGAVLGPLIAFAFKCFDTGWRLAFGLCALGPILLLIFILPLKLPPAPPAEVKEKFGVYRKPLLWLIALSLFSYCGVEWGIGAWFPSYWKEVPVAAVLDPSLATSLFWLTFSLGRFIAGSWADRLGFRKFLSISIAATLVVCLVWLFFPQPMAALVLVLVLGFVIAGQYPTFVALISKAFPKSSGQVTSVLSVFAALGTLIWPPATGSAADSWGITVLPWVEMIITAVMLIFALIGFSLDRKREKTAGL